MEQSAYPGGQDVGPKMGKPASIIQKVMNYIEQQIQTQRRPNGSKRPEKQHSGLPVPHIGPYVSQLLKGALVFEWRELGVNIV